MASGREGRHASRLVLACGLPASGKTTLARELEESIPAVRMCPDEWMTSLGIHGKDDAARSRIERLQWDLSQRLLLLGQSVVLEFGFWRRHEREVMRLWARGHGVPIELRFLDVPPAELARRVAARNPTLDDPTMAITPGEMTCWNGLFQRPEAAELALYDV